MQTICQPGENHLTGEGAGCWRQARGAWSSELLGVLMAILLDAGRLTSHLPTTLSHRGENEPQALVTFRRTGSLVDVHCDGELQGCRDAMDCFQRKKRPVRALTGTPVHCIQLWSCQNDVVSGAIL